MESNFLFYKSINSLKELTMEKNEHRPWNDLGPSPCF